MATHSRILAWRIPWGEEPGRLQSMGSQELDVTKVTLCISIGSLIVANILLKTGNRMQDVQQLSILSL